MKFYANWSIFTWLEPKPKFLQVNGYLLTSNSKTLREIREEEMESGTYSATIKCCSDGKKESLALSLVLDNCRCQ